MKKIFSVAALFALSVCSFAYFNGGVNAVSGSDEYQSYRFFGEIGTESGFSLRPQVYTFKDKFVSSTMMDYRLRAGMDTQYFGVGLTGLWVPEQNGYSRKGGVADVTFTFSPTEGKVGRLAGPSRESGAKSSRGVTRIDVGGSLHYYQHRFTSAYYAPLTGDSLDINETDMSLFAGVEIMGTVLSGTYMKNLNYSKTAPESPQPYMNDLPGLMTYQSGYVNQSWNLRLDWNMIPAVSPFLSYTYTQYKTFYPNSKNYLMGISANLSMLNVTAAYQIYDPGESLKTRNAFTLGAGLQF
ncbi:MAG: hypothetical protein WCS77_04500 [Elusimicrobiaceae bacterium]